MSSTKNIKEIFSNYQTRFSYQSFENKEFTYTNPKAIVVIPCFNETTIVDCLNSLYTQNDSANIPSYECIIVVNQAENTSSEIQQTNQQTILDIQTWKEKKHIKNLTTINYLNMPIKHAGVGLARKTGMDEAARRFAEKDNSDGIIICLDADSKVENNYIQTIIDSFEKNKESGLAAIRFKHQINNLDERSKLAIELYEKHLQYYVDAMTYCGHPNNFHTIGSSMAVKILPYLLCGGMNKRKAGEDFYFMHKIAKTYTCININETCVHPSARVSNRVPFGTGKAIGEMLKNDLIQLKTYHPSIFNVIKKYIAIIKNPNQLFSIEQFPDELKEYMIKNNHISMLQSIQKQALSQETYTQRLFHWFDGFEMLKMVHHLRDHFYGEIDIIEAKIDS
ncbi:MAG: glycosyltransferase family 2 protein [Bacteroidetes bacterium]|nr:glycosyltransferase family 2 protein [Bacteroidota bacterium]